MSIATRTGDGGETGLMFGARLKKTDPRFEVMGTIDELSAFLGQVRLTAPGDFGGQVLQIQKDLIVIMGEMAVLDQDWERFASEPKYARVTPELLERLDKGVQDLENSGISFMKWAISGESPHSTACHVARTVCRRAERSFLIFSATSERNWSLTGQYLNRLSDYLWLLACVEKS